MSYAPTVKSEAIVVWLEQIKLLNIFSGSGSRQMKEQAITRWEWYPNFNHYVRVIL